MYRYSDQKKIELSKRTHNFSKNYNRKVTFKSKINNSLKQFFILMILI